MGRKHVLGAIGGGIAGGLGALWSHHQRAIKEVQQLRQEVADLQVGDAELARVQQQRADARQEAQRLTLQLHNHTHDAERLQGRLENAVASAEAAQLEGQQLRKALNEQQNEAEKMKGQVKEAAQNAECAGQQIQHLTTETAGVRAELEKEVSCLKQTLAAQKQASEEAQATALAQVLSLTEQLEQMSTASQTQDTALLSLKEKLQQADQEKTDEVQSAKSEVQGLHALLTSLKAELTEQKQVVEAQQSKLQAASGLKTQLTELEGQLEEQKKVIAAKEELTKKNFAPKKEQAQEVASMKARLAEEQKSNEESSKALQDKEKELQKALKDAQEVNIGKDEEVQEAVREVVRERDSLKVEVSSLTKKAEAQLQQVTRYRKATNKQLAASQKKTQGVQNELASAKEALKAADSSSQVQQLQGLVEELQASKADLQQLVQSLQVQAEQKTQEVNAAYQAVEAEVASLQQLQLFQAAGAGQLAAVPSLQSAPLGLTQPANLDPPGSVLHPRDPGLAASASSNQQQIKELCSVVEGKDRCLRTAEAFIEAHLLQLQQQEWSMNIHKGQRDCARKEVRRLRSELQPLQQEHDMAHHRHDAADLPKLHAEAPLPLGSGTFGHALACYSPTLGQYVVKSPAAQSSADDMDREARHLSMFRHPNIVQYFGRESAPTAVPGILLERMNMDLDKYMHMRLSHLQTVEMTMSIGRQMAAGVNCLHARGDVHGDLKANNVGVGIFTDPVTVKLLDLGLVKEVGLYDCGRSLPFNLRYCPPEIAAVFCPSRENTYDLTTAAEVFNFGLVLAEVAGATRLHPITDEQEYRRRLTCMSYDSWVQFPRNHGYPRQFVQIVKDCVKKDPTQRPSMADVVWRLGNLVR